MTQDSTFGSIWKVTIRATNTVPTGGLLFTQTTNFSPKWARGASATNNTTIGNAALGDSNPDLDHLFTNGFFYTFTLAGSAADANRAYAVMATATNPVAVLSVFDNAPVASTGAVTVTVQLSSAPSPQESIWVRATTNSGFSPSWLIPATGSGTNFSATIPAQVAGARVFFYVLTSTMPSNVITSNFDLTTLRGRTAGATNFSYRAGAMNAWHLPTNAEPFGAFMRNPPTNGVTPSTPVFFYSGSQTNGAGNAANQSGMALIHRLKGSGTWTTNSGSFDTLGSTANNAYWISSIAANTYAATNEVEYYLRVTATDHNTTFIGSTNNLASLTFLTESAAQAATFSFTYGSGTNLGNCFHIPAAYEPTSNPPFQVTMRNPLAPTRVQPVFLYNGNQFAGGGNAANQTGGTLYFRKVGAGAWSSAALSFDTEQGNNKYWVGSITGSTYAAGDEVEYYFRVVYSDRATTFVGTTNAGVASLTSGSESFIQTNAFRFTYAANLGNSWHIPAANEPPGTTMRNPLTDPQTNQAVFLYNGNQFQGAGTPGDQSGGRVVYRRVGDTAWLTNTMVFNAESGEVGNNKYWRGQIPAGAFATTNEVEYYLVVTYTDRDTTYLGSTNNTASTRYSAESQAQANTFRYTYSPQEGLAAAFLWHADNRVVVNASNVQFWVKIGYAEGTGSNRFVDHSAVYYTTDGATPGGAKGQPTNGSTQVAMMQFSHMEEDGYEGGDAMWWVGTVTNLPQFTTIRYKIGAYKATNTLERFADYGTSGTNNAVFAFSLGTLGSQTLTINGINADYTTTKFFVDEIAGDVESVVVQYTPGVANVTNVEVFSNLDRRDYVSVDYTNALISADGYEDGIRPPDGNLLTIADTGAYFRAWTMTGAGTYHWTGTVRRTGAYRLTARFQTNGSPTWTWYSSGGRRDHAIVVSPTKALDMTLYELHTPTVEATAPSFAGRSTFRDLLSTNDVAGDDDSFDPFNLEWLNYIQANCIWFQPVHPNGFDRSENDPLTGTPYQPGSPYATKDYWGIMPVMGAANNAANAMEEFTNFVAKCDEYAGSVGPIHIMLDGVFNHSSWDAVMGQGGVDLGFTTNPNVRIGSVRPGWYSRITDYGEPATFYNSAWDNNFATAPDRGDFGKWNDVTEFYFGKYSALVRNNPERNGDYLNEDDVYDFAGMTPDTKDLWRYFGYYAEFWIKKTGHTGTNTWVLEEDDRGIDALRCDFGQGLPPPLWEYIINRTRSKKWNFVFMAETLDGGKPGYRSNRHFDILNENMVFQFTQAKINDSAQLSSAFLQRNAAYNGGAILLNLTSHDEVMPDNDGWVTASRYAAVSMLPGLPMLFYGQEKGIGLFDPAQPNLALDGFADHELNFGKHVPHFKRWNQLTVWNNPPPNSDGLDQWYGRVNWARLNSPALRSRNNFILNTTGGGQDSRIFAVAKWEQTGAGPATSDVVLAFSRFMEHGGGHTLAANTYNLQPVWGLLGLDTGKTYTVRNLASSNAFAPLTNGWPKTGADLFNNGIFVSLPVDVGGPITRDGAIVQYLKLEEVATSTNAAPVISLPGPHILALGSTTSFPVTVTDANGNAVTTNFANGPAGAIFTGGTFTWTATPTNFVNTTNLVVFTANDGQGATNSIVTNSTTIVVPFDFDNDGIGDDWEVQYFAALTNTPDADGDGDRSPNLDEYIAGTDPTQTASVFRVLSVLQTPGGTNRSVTVPTVQGRRYKAHFANGGYSNAAAWASFANTNIGFGTYVETNPTGTHTFVDDETANTTLAPPPNGQRTYRITVERSNP